MYSVKFHAGARLLGFWQVVFGFPWHPTHDLMIHWDMTTDSDGSGVTLAKSSHERRHQASAQAPDVVAAETGHTAELQVVGSGSWDSLWFHGAGAIL